MVEVATVKSNQYRSVSRMADVADTLARLQETRNQLLGRLKEVEDLIVQLQRIQGRIGSIESGAQTSHSETPVGPAWAPRRGATSPAEIADRVARILFKVGKPMTRSQIARQLADDGVLLIGRDVNKNIGTILWRNSNRFVNLDRLGYWLADVPLEGIYNPMRGRNPDFSDDQ